MQAWSMEMQREHAINFISGTHARAKCPSTSPSRAQKSVEAFYDNHPFDAAAEHVPPEFWRVDILKLALYTEASPPACGPKEFETTDAYKARRSLFEETPLVPGLKPSDRMAFVFRQSSEWNSPVRADYDADSEQFHVSVHSGLASAKEGQRSQTYGVLTMQQFQVAEQKYVASNAMGVEVDDTSYRDFGIAVRPRQGL